MPKFLLQKIFNLSAHEVPRTVYAWIAKFLYKAGLIMGFTVITAMFVTRFSIVYLPVLFLLQAVFTILGMFLFSFLNDNLSSKNLIAMTAFIAAILIFSSTFAINNDYLFFFLVLAAMGLFIAQLNIFLSNYIEDFFTPVECVRTFPVIESAETIGGMVAGLLVTLLSTFVLSYKLLYIWVVLLFFVVGVVFLLEPASSNYFNLLEKKEIKSGKIFSFKRSLMKIKNNFKEISAIPFLQGLLLVFLLQWIIAHFVEFQYTSAIDSSIGHESESSHEGGLAHGLGSFQMIFHACVLLVQLLVAGRILKSLGTVGGILLHTLVTFLSAISLLFGFGYFTAILAKNNFEVSGIINKNAYESAYYALRHGTARNIREFFEAFIYPIGTIIGTLFILGIQFFFLKEHTLPVIQLFLIFFVIAMITIALHLQNRYTALIENNLVKSESKISKLHAIEILGEKGHKKNINILVNALKSSKNSDDIKIKILENLARTGNTKVLPEILSCFYHKNDEVILAAIEAIKTFPKLNEYISTQTFSKYRIMQELEKTFLHSSEKIQIAVIETMTQLKYENIAPFLLKVLNTGSYKIKLACIKICRLFNDPNVAYFLEPYLKAKNPFVKAQTIVALYQFKKYRSKLKSILNSMMFSSKPDEILAAISIMGDLKEFAEKNRLIPYLTVVDPTMRLYASYSLLKLEYKEAATYLAHLLLSKNLLVLEKAKELLVNLNSESQTLINNALQKEVALKIHDLFAEKKELYIKLRKVDLELLERLKNAYMYIKSYKEADFIDEILKHQNKIVEDESSLMEPLANPVLATEVIVE